MKHDISHKEQLFYVMQSLANKAVKKFSLDFKPAKGLDV